MCLFIFQFIHDRIEEFHRQMSGVGHANMARMQIDILEDDFLELRLNESVVLNL